MFQRSDGLWVEHINVNGKRKDIYAKTKAALKKKMLEIGDLQQSKTEFRNVAAEWEEKKESEIAFNTMQAYKPHVQRAVDYFGSDSVEEITPAQIQAFIDHLANSGYAKDTVHRALVVCRMIFDYAIVMPGSDLRYNPCTSVKIPRGLKKERREPPTVDQLAKITPDSEMGLFAWFLLCTGLRRGELLALRYEDIDRESKQIHVSKAVYFENNQPVIKAPKTEAGNRTVELVSILEDAIPDKKHGYIFGGDKPLTHSAFTKRWLHWCKEIGLAEEVDGHWKPTISPHQFRHWYATMLEAAGVSETGAMAALGHSSISTTKNIYTHIRSIAQLSIKNGDKINGCIEGVLNR